MPNVPGWDTGRAGRDYTGDRSRTRIFPGDLTAREYLKAQPSHVQLEVLGTTRYYMLGDGKLSWNELWDDEGHFLLLKELAPGGKVLSIAGEPLRKI